MFRAPKIQTGHTWKHDHMWLFFPFLLSPLFALVAIKETSQHKYQIPTCEYAIQYRQTLCQWSMLSTLLTITIRPVIGGRDGRRTSRALLFPSRPSLCSCGRASNHSLVLVYSIGRLNFFNACSLLEQNMAKEIHAVYSSIYSPRSYQACVAPHIRTLYITSSWFSTFIALQP